MEPKVWIGMGGWELPPFKKYFYPPKPKKTFRKLEYYSQYFDSIEVNSSFYNAALQPHHSQQWLTDVSGNKEFIFTVKLYRGFTHTFNATRGDVKAVHHLLGPLTEAGKLGGLVIQFPYSFFYTPEHKEYVARLGKAFNPHRIFVEFRHKSWNNSATNQFLSDNYLHSINVDMPQIKNHAPFTNNASGGVVYYRLMGRNALTWSNPLEGERYDYFYSEEELQELVRRIQEMRKKLNSVFVVFHNDPGANSLVNGFQLRHFLHQSPRQMVPQGLVYVCPGLKQISASVDIKHPLFEEV